MKLYLMLMLHGLVLCGYTWGQTPVRELEEVIVTDDHANERKKEETLNLEIVSPGFIRRNLGGSLMQSLERLPGVKTIGIGSGQSKPLIRGLGFNRVMVVDKGVKHEGQQWGADHGLEIDQFAGGEVELLKGAASFLYGSDAIAGVIHIKPAALPAKYTTGGAVELVGKSNNSLYGGSVHLFSRAGKWFYEGRVTYQNYGDYRVPADSIAIYDYKAALHKRHVRNTAGRELNWHFNTGIINDRWSSVFYISNMDGRSGFFANARGLEPTRVDPVHDRSSRDLLTPLHEINHFKVINRSHLQLDNQRWEMELGYQHNFRQEINKYRNHGYMPAQYPAYMTIPFDVEREYDKQVYSLNIRDQLSWGKHTVTIGGTTEHQHNTISGWSFLMPAYRQTTAGVFVLDSYALNENTGVQAALRYDYGNMRTYRYADWFTTPINHNGQTSNEYLVRANDIQRDFSNMVWSLGIHYHPNRFLFKANVGKSFRMPTAGELSANGVNYDYFRYELGNENVSAEQSYQLDVSAGWQSEKWQWQLSPFFNYFSNYIYLNPTARHDNEHGAGNQVFEYTQAKVIRYGGELQVKYKPHRAWSTELVAEYLFARQQSGPKEGSTLPFSPPPTALMNITWSPKGRGALGNSYISLDYRVAAAQNRLVPPEKKTPGYGVMHMQAGTRLTIGKTECQLNLQVQNVLNTRYFNHTSFYRLIELPEAGRNIILLLKVPFTVSAGNRK